MDLLYTAHVPPGDGPFPTILALHGWGASAHDLLGLAPLLHRGEALVLCPQGPVTVPLGPGIEGYGWFPLGGGREPDPLEVARGLGAVESFLEAAARAFPIDPRKLVLLGFSQGGVLAYQLALRDPARFAGLVALCSWLPAPLAASVVRKPEHEALPALVVHGTRDPMIPVERGRESRDALLGLGVPTTYREYAMGHEIAPDALRTLIEWLEDEVFTPVRLVGRA
jgi:phospholipase/carboxylesterase